MAQQVGAVIPTAVPHREQILTPVGDLMQIVHPTSENVIAPSGPPTLQDGPRLDVVDVCVKFGGISALDRVSFSVAQKQIYGLIGPNGAGKTTLVNCLSGYQRPSSGTVCINGEDASSWSPGRLRRAGIARTFQSGRLFGRLTVYENVEAGLLGLGYSRRKAAAKVDDTLEMLDLQHEAHKLADALPYTATRLVSLARAIVQAPDFLLLDEPAAGMSDSEVEALTGLIASLPERFSCGVLLIEHNMSLIRALCERVHVLDGGRTLADNRPDEALSDPVVAAAYLGVPVSEEALDVTD